MCRSSVDIDSATVLDRVSWTWVELGALGSRYTRILLGAAPACCSTLTTTSFSDASIVSSDLSPKIENPGEMNLVLLTVKLTLLLAQMLTLSQRLQIGFEI